MQFLFDSNQSHFIAPSFLAADFGHIADEVAWLEHPDVDMIHLDVMDGIFVPNISFGLPVIECIRGLSSKPLDVHLMIQRPDDYVEAFREVGASIITVHYEVCSHLHRTIQKIKEAGALAGVALNPHTPVCLLTPLLDEIDLVCLMSVNPGFGGQKFIPGTLDKIRKLRSMIDEKGVVTKIEVDGGVGLGNAKDILAAGADVLVAGSAIFNSDDRDNTLQILSNV